jgi:hypothetical protein
MVDLMDKKSTALIAVTALPCTGWFTTATLVAIPVHAAETANTIRTEYDWLILGGLLVLTPLFCLHTACKTDWSKKNHGIKTRTL